MESSGRILPSHRTGLLVASSLLPDPFCPALTGTSALPNQQSQNGLPLILPEYLLGSLSSQPNSMDSILQAMACTCNAFHQLSCTQGWLPMPFTPGAAGSVPRTHTKCNIFHHNPTHAPGIRVITGTLQMCLKYTK